MTNICLWIISCNNCKCDVYYVFIVILLVSAFVTIHRSFIFIKFVTINITYEFYLMMIVWVWAFYWMMLSMFHRLNFIKYPLRFAFKKLRMIIVSETFIPAICEFLHKARVFVRLGHKSLPGTNTLAYYENS
jgi:hypothetical protein